MNNLTKIIIPLLLGSCLQGRQLDVVNDYNEKRLQDVVSSLDENKIKKTSHNDEEKDDEKKYQPCPKNMVNIENKFCIDKWESSIVDKITGSLVSSNYTASFNGSNSQHKKFEKMGINEKKLEKYVQRINQHLSKKDEKLTDKKIKSLFDSLKSMPDRGAEKNPEFKPMAVSLPTMKPASYVNRFIANEACMNAQKRLCTSDEFYQACVGPKGPKPFMNNKGEKEFPDSYPYGSKYESNKCNIGSLKDGMWPPGILGRRNNGEMMDPRIANLVNLDNNLMISNTGYFSECVSGYGVYDLVGNLHEITADVVPRKIKRATYMGSHFARNKKESCGEITQGHWFGYSDYSIGFRCCKSISKL